MVGGSGSRQVSAETIWYFPLALMHDGLREKIAELGLREGVGQR